MGFRAPQDGGERTVPVRVLCNAAQEPASCERPRTLPHTPSGVLAYQAGTSAKPARHHETYDHAAQAPTRAPEAAGERRRADKSTAREGAGAAGAYALHRAFDAVDADLLSAVGGRLESPVQMWQG